MERRSVSEYIDAALNAIKAHDLSRAQQYLDGALSLDYENPRVLGLLKYLGFWTERQNSLANMDDNLEKSSYLLSQWAQFQHFMARVGLFEDETTYVLRQLVFGQALNFLSVYNNEAGAGEPEILYRVGVCLKGIGNYDAARRFLETANSAKRDSPAIMADLADAYALVNEIPIAKALFREAFFLDPQDVHLETLESEMMLRLVKAVRDMGFQGQELLEWLPVYGQLLGIFTVTRELRAIEYGKLLQSIFQLEREFQEGPRDPALTLPRLLNHYFWLLEHSSRTQKDGKRVQELLLKIRSVSPHIYELYTK